jgi:ribosomal protein L29
MKDLHNKSIKDLIKMLNDRKDPLHGFQFGNAGSKSRNVKEGKQIKKDIARIMTAVSVIAREDAKNKKANAKTA